MLLPRGITGFSVPADLPGSDAVAFRADCWQVVQPLKGRVEDRPQVLDARVTSFMTQVLVLPAAEVTVLLNKVHPWVGFCRPLDPGDCSMEFVDAERVAAAFAGLGRYRVLSGAELDQPVGEAMCAALGHAERQQLNYWAKLAGRGKLRVGDVVFNFWD